MQGEKGPQNSVPEVACVCMELSVYLSSIGWIDTQNSLSNTFPPCTQCIFVCLFSFFEPDLLIKKIFDFLGLPFERNQIIKNLTQRKSKVLFHYPEFQESLEDILNDSSYSYLASA